MGAKRDAKRPPDDHPSARIASLCETGSAILETLDLEDILAIVTQRAERLFRSSGASVAYYDPNTGELEVAGGSGSLTGAKSSVYRAAGTLSETAILENRPVVENDLPEEPFYESLALRPDEPRRALVVPLRARDGAIGTLALVGKEGDSGFDQEDADLLYAFGHLAGLAIQNARLLEAETARAKQSDTLRAEREDHILILQDLHDAEVAVSSDLELGAVLQTLADKARELTSAQYGALGVLGEGGAGLERFVTSGITEEERARLGATPAGLGLLGAVTRSESVVRVDDVASDPRSAGMPGQHPAMDSFLGISIRIGDRVFGNLYLTNKKGGFTERDETIVSMLAAHAAVAIENARQFRTLQRLLDKLRSTQQQRDRFYAFVNHDLRNACSGVLMWSERLTARVDPANRDVADKIRRGSEHAMRLVQDVLDLEYLGQGRLETWPRMIVVHDLLQAALDGIRPEAEKKDMKIRLSRGKVGLRMVADPDRVLQIVTNLLSNAIKYSPERTEVRIAAELREEGPGGFGQPTRWVAVDVTDQGPGIPPEDVERIFGEYVTGAAGRTSRGGMGIGLTLSRRLAEYMGGALSVQSEPGQGSTFTLWIPHGRQPERRSGWIG